eukprot:gene33411-43189_t
MISRLFREVQYLTYIIILFQTFSFGEAYFNDIISEKRAEKLNKIVRIIQSKPLPLILTRETWSAEHNITTNQGQAIFAGALHTTYIGQTAQFFAGTARRAGFRGDIVVAVLPGSQAKLLARLKQYNVVVYTVSATCDGKLDDVRCSFAGLTDIPVTVLRYFIYQVWALSYPESTEIMLSDYRDVFFQSNPFKYKVAEWGPLKFQLVVFQESHPNRVINRCSQNAGYILNCYGLEPLKTIGSNTISSSGSVIGTRNAIAAYAYFITLQLDPSMRSVGNSSALTANKNCLVHGVDQGFHNWLLYSGQLSQMMNVKIYQQGEGPVNTVGGFFGERKILKALLQDWKVVKGDAPYKYVYNWNGEISPTVHQMDRFLTTELLGGYQQHMAVFQNLP